MEGCLKPELFFVLRSMMVNVHIGAFKAISG